MTGPLLDDVLAGRLSAATTGRSGVLDNVTTGGTDNNVRNSEVRAQLLYTPLETFRLRLIGDYSSFDSHCCTQVYLRGRHHAENTRAAVSGACGRRGLCSAQPQSV